MLKLLLLASFPVVATPIIYTETLEATGSGDWFRTYPSVNVGSISFTASIPGGSSVLRVSCFTNGPSAVGGAGSCAGLVFASEIGFLSTATWGFGEFGFVRAYDAQSNLALEAPIRAWLIDTSSFCSGFATSLYCNGTFTITSVPEPSITKNISASFSWTAAGPTAARYSRFALYGASVRIC